MFDTTQANCIDAPPEIFFPENVYTNRFDIMRAKMICDGCPVKAECLTQAITNDEYGIWGGTTREERRSMRRRLRISLR